MFYIKNVLCFFLGASLIVPQGIVHQASFLWPSSDTEAQIHTQKKTLLANTEFCFLFIFIYTRSVHYVSCFKTSRNFQAKSFAMD